MAVPLIQDWLSDYATLELSESRSFIAQHENNYEIATALNTIFNERMKYAELIHPVCNQLYRFYQSNEPQLKCFTLQFLPVLIYIYLNSVAIGDKKTFRCVEVLLIGVYNIEISNDDGKPKIVSFRMPVLAQTSIYHEEKSFHATDLRRFEENSNKDVNWGPLAQIESLNAQNRLKIMTALLFIYNQQLSLIQKPALYHLCRTASQFVNQGFHKLGHSHRPSYGNDPNLSILPKPLARIPMSSQFMLELLHAVYFAMFNEFASIAIQTVDDIHYRAGYEMYPDVLLVTNAIKNSLHANPSGQPSDGPMGISVALTPATTTVIISKSMITNASFRAKKLPDDIPIQGPKDDNVPLVSITEESSDSLNDPQQLAQRNSAVRSSKDSNSQPSKSHKVPFGAFKKKDKDQKVTKNGSTLPDSGSKDNSTPLSSNANLPPPPPPTKRSTLKDKLISKGSALQLTGGASESIAIIDAEKQQAAANHQVNLSKRKSVSVDLVNGPIGVEIMPLQSLSNGNGMIGGGGGSVSVSGSSGGLIDEIDNVTTTINSIDIIDVKDLSSDLAPMHRSSIEIKTHGSIQVSQV